jgi:hypothetical protein
VRASAGRGSTSCSRVGDAHAFEQQLHATGFDLREVEHVGDERQQVLAGAGDFCRSAVRFVGGPSASASSCSISL